MGIYGIIDILYARGKQVEGGKRLIRRNKTLFRCSRTATGNKNELVVFVARYVDTEFRVFFLIYHGALGRIELTPMYLIGT